MSLKENAFSGLNSVIFTFINLISQKYNINSNELKSLWEGESNVIPVVASSVVSSSSPAAKELENLTKTQLIEMCKTKNLKVSGTKNELIARILESESIIRPTPPPVVQTTTTTAVVRSPTIIKKLVDKIPKLEIKRNSDGYYVHEETSFVFDTKTQKVYGKLDKNNKIEELSADDIDICNKYKFSYVLPNNLDKKINILDVKVDELDDEVELEDDLDDEFNEDDEDLEEEIELEEDEYYEE
jgi:hypothetical protein